MIPCAAKPNGEAINSKAAVSQGNSHCREHISLSYVCTVPRYVTHYETPLLALYVSYRHLLQCVCPVEA